MFLNSISPADGSRKKRKRVGRGIGCTLGKTCGRGHKGQHARAGGFHKVGFEGGQMPLQRRLPKVGFKSRTKKFTAEIRLSELERLESTTVDLAALKAADIVGSRIRKVKVIDSGKISKALILKGVTATAGAAKKIESVGGKIEV